MKIIWQQNYINDCLKTSKVIYQLDIHTSLPWNCTDDCLMSPLVYSSSLGSVTRCLDYLLDIWSLTPMQICPIAEVCLKIGQILNKPCKISKDFLNFCPIWSHYPKFSFMHRIINEPGHLVLLFQPKSYVSSHEDGPRIVFLSLKGYGKWQWLWLSW